MTNVAEFIQYLQTLPQDAEVEIMSCQEEYEPLELVTRSELDNDLNRKVCVQLGWNRGADVWIVGR